MPTSSAPSLGPSATQQPFDGSGHTTYLHVDVQGNHLRLSSSARALLDAVDAGLGFDTIAAHIRRGGGQATTDSVEQAHRRLRARLDDVETRTATRRRPWGFWGRVALLSPDHVQRLATPLAVLLSPGVAIAAVVLIATGMTVLPAAAAALDGASLIQALPLFFASMLIHELGHAAACCRFAQKPAEIGFTFYLAYPALYCDVTRVWGLRRPQRVVVDLAGNYFQLLTAALYAALFGWTGHASFAVALVMIVASTVLSLNPVLRFDGYWALTDTLGVSRPGQAARDAWRAWFARRRTSRDRRGPRPGWVTATLLLYGPLCLVVWGGFAFRLVPTVLATSRDVPTLILDATRAVTTSATLPPGSVQALFTSLYMLLVASHLAVQLALRCRRGPRAVGA